MSISHLMKRAALAVPRIRRHYEFASRLARDFEALQREHAALVTAFSEERDELNDALRHAYAVLDSERARTQEIERGLENQEHRSAEVPTRSDPQLRRIAELEAQLGGWSTLRTDLAESNARLLGRMSVISGELLDLRRMLTASVRSEGDGSAELRLAYLDLLEAALTGLLHEDPSMAPWAVGYDPAVRAVGRDWPSLAQTMIGTARMRNIRALATQLLDEGIAGDFLEAGVWRGGACIYMRGILAAHADRDRRVFVADSFAGLPKPTPDRYPADQDDQHHTVKELAVPLQEVKANFARYGLLDARVVFLQGWFKDTLPKAPVDKLALLRLDGDMYSSTTETLEALYEKVSPGGFVIIDDYILPACRQAVGDFRARFRIQDEISDIDGTGVFWRKSI